MHEVVLVKVLRGGQGGGEGWCGGVGGDSCRRLKIKAKGFGGQGKGKGVGERNGNMKRARRTCKRGGRRLQK